MSISQLSSVTWESAKTGVLQAGTQAINSPVTTLKAVGSVAANAFKCYMLYSMYEAALSDILCLKTLRHGTNPYAFTRIQIEGPNPKRGGTGGEARFFETLETNSPYAAGDHDCFFVVEDFTGEETTKTEAMVNYIGSKLTVKFYSLRSTLGSFGSILPLPSKWRANVTKFTLAFIDEGDGSGTGFLGFLCPSVKFHINPDSFERVYSRGSLKPGEMTFAKDGDEFQGALVTKYKFSVLDMGFIGILKNGINRDLPKRMLENKGQVLWGVAQLTMAVAMTAFIYPALFPFGGRLVKVVESITEISKTYGIITGLPIAVPLIYSMAQL